jgi:hypothetical protein
LSPRTELALAVAAVVIVAAPSLVGAGVDFPDDALYYGVTSWEWLRHAIRSGEPIWWVPGKLGGVSLYGDVMPMGPLYPFAWLGVVLPVILAMGISVLVHAVGTLLAVRWFARLRGASPGSATLAGAAVVLGPLGSAAFVDFQVDSWPAFLWLPVVLGCLERASGATTVGTASPPPRARLTWLAAAGGALGLLLLGSHLRVGVGACGVIGVWVLAQGRDLPGAVLACAIGLLIGAPGYLPMLLEASASAADGATRAGLGAPIDQALGLHAIGGWLAPTVLSSVRDISLGAVLGAAALVGAGVDRRGAAAVALLILAGTHLPGVRFALAPLLLLSHPVNLVWPVLALIPAATLAARGLDRLLAMPDPDRRQRLNGPLGVVLGTLFAAKLVFGEEPYVAVLLALAAVVGAFALMGAGRRELVFALVLAELLGFGVRAHLAVPSTPLTASADAFRGDPALLQDGFLDLGELADGFDSVLTGGDAASVEELAGFENELAEASAQAVENEIGDPRIDGPAMQAKLLTRTYPPHLGMALGVRGLAGRSKLMPDRQVAALRPLAEALHDNRGVEYFLPQLFGRTTGLGATTLALHGIPFAVWRDIAAFRIEAVAPLCYSPSRTDVEPGAGERVRRLLASDGRFDARAALLEAALPTPLPKRHVVEHLSCAEPGITDISTSTGALVVRRERWHPGWRVVDQTGQQLPAFPVNQVHLGVVVAPGTSRLTYRFVPPGLPKALIACALGWLLCLVTFLGGRRRAVAAATVATALLLPALAAAAPIEGTVTGWSERAEYEVWLTHTLDLTVAPLARAPVEAETGAFTLVPPPGASGDGWIYLLQVIEPKVGPPIRLHLPLDLDPFDLGDPPAEVRIRGVSPLLAELRARNEPIPGWWLVPAVLCLWIYLFALIARGVIQWRLQMVAGARALLGAMRSSQPDAEPNLLEVDRRTAPRATRDPVPVPGPRERAALGAALVVGLLLRLRGMVGSSFDLLEHTYGPGSRPLDSVPLRGLELLLEMLLRPSAVEVTHPPVYHWVLGLLGFVSSSEWFLRLPSLAASMATIVVVWTLFRRLDPAAGVLGAALYAVVAPAVHFGADATPYALSALIAVGSLELMLRALTTGTPRDWRRWTAVLAIGFLCHYSVALFGLAQAGTLVVMCVMRARRPAWLGALHRALGAVMLLAPLPLAWCFVHFAWYDPVALDTRLFASSYAKDPGLASFAAQFGAVSVGVPPTAYLAASAFGVTALAGLVVAHRRDRELGLLLLASSAAFVGGTVFFHSNLVAALDGRVFWGFRWVSWVLPIAMGLAAVGVVEASRRAVTAIPAGVLGLIWASSAIPFVAALPSHSTRPDYETAAVRIVAELEDRDAIATLPLWGQRGPLTWYLSRASASGFREVADGVDGWFIDGKRVFAEATFEDLPFETSARSSWFDRIWVVVVDERVFGKPKFSQTAADRAVLWAREHLTLEQEWTVDGLRVYAFRPRPEPPRRVRIVPPELGLTGIRWLEPNQPGCREGDEENSGTHWRLHARVPLRPGAGQPRVDAQNAKIQRRDDPGHWTATILGGPCSAPAPVVTLTVK